MRAPPAFDNRDDLIYNDRYMKKCSILKFVTAVAACAATLIAVFSAGCFLFKSDVLDTPYLEKYGSIYSWNEVDGANKYLVRTGGESVYTTECEIRVTNPEAGGQLSVTALNVVNGEVKAKSEAALIEFAAISNGGVNYAEYGDGDKDNDNVNSGLAGVYKFYAASNGEETFGIGDALPDGEVLTSDFATLTLNADGTFEIIAKGETKSGTWESGGNLVVLTDENGNSVSARLKDAVLELRQGDYTLSFRK